MYTLCHLARIRNVSIKLEWAEAIALDLSKDVMDAEVYAASGEKLGVMRELFFEKWNAGDLPSEVGRYEQVEFLENPCQMETLRGLTSVRVYADLEVAQGRYVGSFTSEQVAVLDGTSEEEVEMPDIANAWEELEEGVPDPETQATITVVMQY